jgi:RHS repeat-associated protein
MRQGSSTLNYHTDHGYPADSSVRPSSRSTAAARPRWANCASLFPRGKGHYPYGATRYSDGSTPTSYRFTGQREDATIGLYPSTSSGQAFYNARYYDAALGRFVQADSIVPSPGNPQSLNRYSYCLGNPLRYADSTGHWTEEQLEAQFGKDWRSKYFGQEAVFEGRDNLLAFLLSEDTTSVAGLELISPFFTLTSAAHDLGMEFGDIDALGVRVASSVGVGAFFGGSIDVVLNLTAGECSVFGSPAAGIMIGEGSVIVGGLTLLKKLPSNDDFRGTFEAIGFVGGDILAVNPERFWSAPLSDRYELTDKANGIFIGVGASCPSLGVYGSMSYSFELYREDAQGGHWRPHRPRALDVAYELGAAIDHDLVQPTVGTIERWLGR